MSPTRRRVPLGLLGFLLVLALGLTAIFVDFLFAPLAILVAFALGFTAWDRARAGG